MPLKPPPAVGAADGDWDEGKHPGLGGGGPPSVRFKDV